MASPTATLIIILILTIEPSSAVHRSQITHPNRVQFPLCDTITNIAQRTVIYKERDIILEIINPTPTNNTTININNQTTRTSPTTTPCSILFRSPHQCPHPYAVQVMIEDADSPQKCHQNFPNCLLHQRVYWTRSGVLELEVSLVNLQPQPRTEGGQLILHVTRLDCDKKATNLHEGDKLKRRPPVMTTGKVRMTINGGGAGLVAMEQQPTKPNNNYPNYNIEPQEAIERDSLKPTKEKDRNNVQLIPHQAMTNFFLASPGFPRNPFGGFADCLFVIPKAEVQTCRLRIHFRFFNLPDPDERSCQHHFLLIDNTRICGCRSGLLYVTQMGNGPKIVRYVNRLDPASSFGAQSSFGFLLEVQREGCPYRYQSAVIGGGARQVIAPRGRDVEALGSGFYRNQYVKSQQCQFSFNDWLKVLANPLWRNNQRQQCIPGENLQYL